MNTELVETHRKKAKMSKVELSEKSGVSRWKIGRLESGVGNVLISDFEKLLEALGLELKVMVKE